MPGDGPLHTLLSSSLHLSSRGFKTVLSFLTIRRFAMLTVSPQRQLTLKAEAHALRLANRNDLWYLGGGAFQPWTFGYQARPSGHTRSLANLYDLSVDVAINAHVSATLYYRRAQGKSVMRSIYPRGANGHLVYLEGNYRF